MKFYEISNPFYALVKSESMPEAREKYTEVISERPHFADMKEVTRDNALVKYARSVGENKRQSSISEVLYNIQNEETKVLVIGGDLI
ncbi:hypothetical protein [Virgibacillus sp. CBA3643]|uniref:hypothetical protein n=1 Tax=Virgibacillus sp. CBA3643 TaxID=2942278 RepID=UPI0035A37D74